MRFPISLGSVNDWLHPLPFVLAGFSYGAWFNFVTALVIHVFFFSNLPEKNFRKISGSGYPSYYEGSV
jgi:hypothetical protein